MDYYSNTFAPKAIPKRGLIIEHDDMFDYDSDNKPSNWINDVLEWGNTTDDAYYLNYYTRDSGMKLLDNYRDNSSSFVDKDKIFSRLNKAIYNSPYPKEGFTILRAGYDPSIVKGLTMTNGICRSGSFSIEHVLQGYYNDGSYVFKIYIPPNSILSYHPSEDQVIFPIGAKFLITSDPYDFTFKPDYEKNGNIVDEIITIHDVIYIGAPSLPSEHVYPVSIVYGEEPMFNTIVKMKDLHYNFPFNPPSKVTLSGEWEMSFIDYEPDTIRGITLATNIIQTTNIIEQGKYIFNYNNHSLTVSNHSESVSIISIFIDDIQINIFSYDPEHYIRGFITIFKKFGISGYRITVSSDAGLFTV